MTFFLYKTDSLLSSKPLYNLSSPFLRLFTKLQHKWIGRLLTESIIISQPSSFSYLSLWRRSSDENIILCAQTTKTNLHVKILVLFSIQNVHNCYWTALCVLFLIFCTVCIKRVCKKLLDNRIRSI